MRQLIVTAWLTTTLFSGCGQRSLTAPQKPFDVETELRNSRSRIYSAIASLSTEDNCLNGFRSRAALTNTESILVLSYCYRLGTPSGRMEPIPVTPSGVRIEVYFARGFGPERQEAGNWGGIWPILNLSLDGSVYFGADVPKDLQEAVRSVLAHELLYFEELEKEASNKQVEATR